MAGRGRAAGRAGQPRATPQPRPPLELELPPPPLRRRLTATNYYRPLFGCFNIYQPLSAFFLVDGEEEEAGWRQPLQHLLCAARWGHGLRRPELPHSSDYYYFIYFLGLY